MQSLIPLLTTILSGHREWFKTKGNSGVFADLSKENLEEGNFENSVLVEANFQGSNLKNLILKILIFAVQTFMTHV